MMNVTRFYACLYQQNNKYPREFLDQQRPPCGLSSSLRRFCWWGMENSTVSIMNRIRYGGFQLQDFCLSFAGPWEKDVLNSSNPLFLSFLSPHIYPNLNIQLQYIILMQKHKSCYAKNKKVTWKPVSGFSICVCPFLFFLFKRNATCVLSLMGIILKKKIIENGS